MVLVLNASTRNKKMKIRLLKKIGLSFKIRRITKCDLRPPLQVKRLGHSVHANGFTPVCRSKCCRKLLPLLNALPHSEHK